jgi:hypothetical protein
LPQLEGKIRKFGKRGQSCRVAIGRDRPRSPGRVTSPDWTTAQTAARFSPGRGAGDKPPHRGAHADPDARLRSSRRKPARWCHSWRTARSRQRTRQRYRLTNFTPITSSGASRRRTGQASAPRGGAGAWTMTARTTSLLENRDFSILTCVARCEDRSPWFR